MNYQRDELQRLHLPSQSENCLFVGSGDSYVASLAAQYFSSGYAICCCPMQIILNPDIAKGRHVYFVSISGNTKANIMAALIAKKNALSTTAVTTKARSRLAKACCSTIELRYRSTSIPTAGTISFTSSVLTCISLASRLKMPRSIDAIYMRADKQAEDAVSRINRKKNNYLILGNNLLYPPSEYGALKFNEVFGAKSIPYSLEEFCHSPLFSLRRGDQTIIMGLDNNGRDLNRRLKREGFSSAHITFKSNGVALLLQSTFFVQLLVLKLAHKFKIDECYFLKNKKLLKLSSDFIYAD